MQEIKRRVNELAEMVKERGGACIIYVDPDGKGENLQLVSEGYERNLAKLIGTAILTNDDVKKCIMHGVEAAQYVENIKKQKNDKADC